MGPFPCTQFLPGWFYFFKDILLSLIMFCFITDYVLDHVLLYSPGCPGRVAQADCKLGNAPAASAS